MVSGDVSSVTMPSGSQKPTTGFCLVASAIMSSMFLGSVDVSQPRPDAWVKGVAEGTIFLLRENVELPFVIERRVGASVTLKDIHYSDGDRAVIGSLGDLAVHIGDQAAVQLVARLAEYLLEQQLPRVNPVPILKRQQVEDLVAPAGSALKMQMGVEDLVLIIDEEDMTLKVRFGFSQLQLTDKGAEAG